jgi:hypothetical protein
MKKTGTRANCFCASALVTPYCVVLCKQKQEVQQQHNVIVQRAHLIALQLKLHSCYYCHCYCYCLLLLAKYMVAVHTESVTRSRLRTTV